MLKWINVENQKCSDTLDYQTKFSKMSKTKKLPPKTPKNQKSKKECSSELKMKTKNVQTHYISKWYFSKISKTQKWPPKTQKKIKIKEGVL